jgi:hypothetical protein
MMTIAILNHDGLIQRFVKGGDSPIVTSQINADGDGRRRGGYGGRGHIDGGRRHTMALFGWMRCDAMLLWGQSVLFLLEREREENRLPNDGRKQYEVVDRRSEEVRSSV